MGFDISIIRITQQQLAELETCATRLYEENQACASICEAEIYEPIDGICFEQVFAEHELIGNVWPDREAIFFGACYDVDPDRLSDRAGMIGITDAELADNPLLAHCLPFEAYYDPTDQEQLASLAPFEAYYAAAEPINHPSSIDNNLVCEQVSAVLDQRKCPNLGYIDSKDIDPKQDYYVLSANLESWGPAEQCMETLVREQLLPDWPIKIFVEADDQAACIGDFQIGYSKLYLLQAVEISLYVHVLKRLARRLLKRHFFMQRVMNRDHNNSLLMPFFCWELRIVDKLIVLLEQAARDQEALVWYTW